MVADNDNNLQYCNTQQDHPRHEGYFHLQHNFAVCIFVGADDIFRGQLLPLRNALVCSWRSGSGSDLRLCGSYCSDSSGVGGICEI